MMVEEKSNQCVGFDITIPEDSITKDDLGVLMTEWCKQWCFQLEEGASGYKHWQVRMKLYSKKYKHVAIKQTAIPGHWSVTSKGVHDHKNFNYVMKRDSRLDGPWDNKSWKAPQVVTRQLRYYRGLTKYRWQAALEERISHTDDRSIVFIRNAKGNAGKSIFVEDMCQKAIATRIPPLRNAKDILQMVYSKPNYKVYCIDMPRAMKHYQLEEFYEAIETIKSGWCYDTRYKGVDRWFDRPQIVIFANMTPKMHCLSSDMWEIYDLHEGKLMRITWDFVGGERHEEYWPF